MTFLASASVNAHDCIMTFGKHQGSEKYLREDLGEQCLNQRRSNYFCKISRQFCSFFDFSSS